MGDVILLLLSIPFWVLGWVVGFVWACTLWVAAAVVAGYRAGQGIVNEHRNIEKSRVD